MAKSHITKQVWWRHLCHKSRAQIPRLGHQTTAAFCHLRKLHDTAATLTRAESTQFRLLHPASLRLQAYLLLPVTGSCVYTVISRVWENNHVFSFSGRIQLFIIWCGRRWFTNIWKCTAISTTSSKLYWTPSLREEICRQAILAFMSFFLFTMR